MDCPDTDAAATLRPPREAEGRYREALAVAEWDRETAVHKLAEAWLTAKHGKDWYIGDATTADLDAAYKAVEAELTEARPTLEEMVARQALQEQPSEGARNG